RALRDPLLSAAAALRTPGDPVTRTALALAPQIEELLTAYPLRDIVTRGEQCGVWVDRPLARFSAWYEMFPRSTGGLDADGGLARRQGRQPPAVVSPFPPPGGAPGAPAGDVVSPVAPAPDPPERKSTSWRPQHHPHRRWNRCGISVGDR